MIAQLAILVSKQEKNPKKQNPRATGRLDVVGSAQKDHHIVILRLIHVMTLKCWCLALSVYSERLATTAVGNNKQ
jgi:hypothetical protein